MSARKSAAPKPVRDAGAKAPKGKKKMLMAGGVAVMMLLGGAGAWMGGLLGSGTAQAHAEPGHAEAAATGPFFVELPDIVANLNAGARRTSFVKMKARLELGSDKDAKALFAAMPRVQDLFTTYLRETRPEELRGSAGTYRLREELIARANLAASPARVRDVLFTEILVQ
jgi:flagellar FliL protein